MVRELPEAPEYILFDCCILIVKFILLSFYSSAETRIHAVKIISDLPVSLLNSLLCVAEHCVLFNCCFNAFTLSEASKFAFRVCHIALSFEPGPEPKLELHLSITLCKLLVFDCSFKLHLTMTLCNHAFQLHYSIAFLNHTFESYFSIVFFNHNILIMLFNCVFQSHVVPD